MSVRYRHVFSENGYTGYAGEIADFMEQGYVPHGPGMAYAAKRAAESEHAAISAAAGMLPELCGVGDASRIRAVLERYLSDILEYRKQLGHYAVSCGLGDPAMAPLLPYGILKPDAGSPSGLKVPECEKVTAVTVSYPAGDGVEASLRASAEHILDDVRDRAGLPDGIGICVSGESVSADGKCAYCVVMVRTPGHLPDAAAADAVRSAVMDAVPHPGRVRTGDQAYRVPDFWYDMADDGTSGVARPARRRDEKLDESLLPDVQQKEETDDFMMLSRWRRRHHRKDSRHAV